LAGTWPVAEIKDTRYSI